MRPATLARLVLGGACLLAPGPVLAAVGAPDRSEARTRAVARVLGGRLVLQAAIDLRLGPRTRLVGIAVDGAHAASMLPLAALAQRHRRSALASAVGAAGIAALDGLGAELPERHRGPSAQPARPGGLTS